MSEYHRADGQLSGIPMIIPLIQAEDVKNLLCMRACIDLMKEVQIAISTGDIDKPRRTFIALQGKQNFMGLMPGELSSHGIFGAKLISLYPDNPTQAGLPAIQGYVMLFDSETGAPRAFVEAASITAIRTAAASAAATDALARKEAKVLTLLGYGVQAASHLEAMLEVRDIQKVYVWGPTLEKARSFATGQSKIYDLEVIAVDTREQAMGEADIVCAVSNASQAIIQGNWLNEGTHINLVGAHTPDTREADANCMSRSRIFTEIGDIALSESGDLLLAIAAGALSTSDIIGEIGLVYKGGLQGRTADKDITLYVSLGNTAQDLISADYVYRKFQPDQV